MGILLGAIVGAGEPVPTGLGSSQRPLRSLREDTQEDPQAAPPPI